MKFIRTNFGKTPTEINVDDAVSHVLYMSAYDRGGELETIKASHDALEYMFSNLLTVLIDNGTLRTADDVAKVLGNSYHVTVED